jgi:hypothetical protein
MCQGKDQRRIYVDPLGQKSLNDRDALARSRYRYHQIRSMDHIRELSGFGNACFGIVCEVWGYLDTCKAIRSMGSVKDRPKRVGCHPCVHGGDALIRSLHIVFEYVLAIITFSDCPLAGVQIVHRPRHPIFFDQPFHFTPTSHPAGDAIQPNRLAIVF